MERINVNFWLNTSKENKKGECPIYLRITVSGKRTVHYTGFKIQKDSWDREKNLVRGQSELANTFNTFADTTKFRVLQVQRDLLVGGEEITSGKVMAKLIGDKNPEISLLKAFERHNASIYALVNKDITASTYSRYLVTFRKVMAYIEFSTSIKDLPLSALTVKFISGFEHYLKVVDNIGQNTASKHLKNLKKVIRFSILQQWMKTDPFSSFRCRTTATERGYLNKAELKILEDKIFTSDRLTIVRDIFIFCCYTGLSYCDVQKLSAHHIIRDNAGSDWIKIQRTKTGTESIIPILDKAREVLNRYNNHPECIYKGRLLPARSNQKMNEYLGEMGAICNISKRITCHLARHTFATTITLANGISTETVGKMLGHKNIRTTQIYAKMTLGRMATEMNTLNGIV